MHHVGHDELAHARWKSRQLLAVVSLSFGVGETNCSQGTAKTAKAANPGTVYRNQHLCHLYSVAGCPFFKRIQKVEKNNLKRRRHFPESSNEDL